MDTFTYILFGISCVFLPLIVAGLCFAGQDPSRSSVTPQTPSPYEIEQAIYRANMRATADIKRFPPGGIQR